MRQLAVTAFPLGCAAAHFDLIAIQTLNLFCRGCFPPNICNQPVGRETKSTETFAEVAASSPGSAHAGASRFCLIVVELFNKRRSVSLSELPGL